MAHFFIIAGGDIDDGFARGVLARHGINPGLRQEGHDGFAQGVPARQEGSRIIAADAGLEFLFRNGFTPDVAIGDFDSAHREALCHFKGQEGILWRELNPVKDDTDTEAAVRLALEMGADGITLLGATGKRLDHLLGNIELLGIGLGAGVPMELLDAYNRVRMVSHGISIRKGEQFGRFVSLIPYTASVEHVTLTGFKYPLEEYCLTGFQTIGVSNEITAEEGVIAFDGGILLVIESRDAA